MPELSPNDSRVTRTRVRAFRGTDAQEREDVVAREGRIRIFLGSDDTPRAAFPCSPEKWIALAIGHAISEGRTVLRAILYLSAQSRDKDECDIRIHLEPLSEKDGVHIHLRVSETFPFLSSPATLYDAMATLEKDARVFQTTGGVHAAAALFHSGSVGPVIEDISRHAAIDKVIGSAAMSASPRKVVALLTTSRASSSLVSKTIDANIPALLARGAPTDKAIRLARDHRLTLIGFLRDKRMNVYQA